MFTCFKCKGSGRHMADFVGDVGQCQECYGTGKAEKNMIACFQCTGTGWVSTPHAVLACPRCKNTGVVEAPPV